MLRMMIYSVVLILLGACSTLDVSTQDTAKPVGKGRVSVSMHCGNSVYIKSTVVPDAEENMNFLGQNANAHERPLFGMKANIGMTAKTDLIVRTVGESIDDGIKLNIKHLISQNGDTYFSIIPGIYYMSHTEFNEDYLYHNYHSKICVAGFEMQLARSKKYNESFTGTIVARANYSLLTEKITGSDADEFNGLHGPYPVTNFGLRANARLYMGLLYLMPEIGVEVVPVVNGNTTILPLFSIGVGLSY